METKMITLRAVPISLHVAIRKAALDAGKNLEQFILDLLANAVK
jgi:hypothetical protein